MMRSDPVPVGSPLPVALELRNHRGIAISAPVDWVRDGGGASILHEGLVFRVWFQADPVKPEPVAGIAPDVGRPAGWREVAPRRKRGHYRSNAFRRLEPTRSMEVMRFDLRELFDLDRPGSYRVEVELGDIRTEEGTPARVSGWFALGSADVP